MIQESKLMKFDRTPEEEINKDNPWYTDQQFIEQLGRAGRKAVIVQRWIVFESVINNYITKSDNTTIVNILDAGCGDGINLWGLTEMKKKNGWHMEISGVDYNPLRVERAANIDAINEVKEGSLLNLPYENMYFDIVLCNHVLEHIHNDLSALNEINRVIKPGGILILGVPNEGCLVAKIRNNFIQPSINRTTDHVQFFTLNEIRKKLHKTGYKVLEVEREGFFLPHLKLNSILVKSIRGRKILDLLKKCFPSQAAGLIIISSKKNSINSE